MTYSNAKQIERLVQVSEMYYTQKYSQNQISEKLHIHRTEISRLLKKARQIGIVKITVAPPTSRINDDLANFMCKNFNLGQAIIVPTEENSDYQDDLESLSVYTNNLLNEFIKDNCVIGLSWGETIKKVIANFFLSKKVKNVSIVPLIGSPMGKLEISCQANHLVHQMCDKIPNSKLFSLDTPVFLNSEKFMHEILSTETNRNSVRLWEKVNIALVGIGSAKMVDNYNWRTFYKKEDGDEGIYKDSMVGDVLSQSFSIDGDEYREVYPNLVGASLSQLRKMNTVIGVAVGESKAEAIFGGLRANLFDILVTTDKVAKQIKKIHLSQM
ncbi:sugar-binding transcriptional regulator [Liquorilactobacillus mali]|uniref:Sorbitol operon transcriptional regulator n=1 Tax=Liquorilactobacillus mali KCTC 3596 = DSM 20444 TaxID=1046596 RepID=J0KYG3_9LACO|nr:sugar-binding domain-containing protein [Liquorilactobacillus mali]EJE99135.1 putative sugar-binding domain protein [Liquorilactobacillus mali KCTC 3596 = DSM 20444]KRN08896.1 sorbitol operon transcriptional regulator [Liquorilactobacillus mali KCTC 3596 = DSM 20444]MDC7952808.1 sugar-binding protein [Liquorilactobacillus mali]QFQ75405.1 sugar-binding protein [Liquorilactobacillus mali]